MLRIMDFLSLGLPIGRYFGIPVRLHFTLFIFAYWRVSAYADVFGVGLALAFVVGFYVCILLHEFGHALAARWCGGDANEILLWPLGGLAMVRPPYHPTAHLISTVAGPFVTLVLWLGLTAAVMAMRGWMTQPSTAVVFVYNLCNLLAWWNFILLIFNLLPIFPMDGGRILRDVIWHWMRAERATEIAVWVSRVLAATAIMWAVASLAEMQGVPRIPTSPIMTIVLAVFILMESSRENEMVRMMGSRHDGFSIRDRLRQAQRQREFRQAAELRGRADATSAFHRCAVCGITERDSPQMSFRVCTDCSNFEEYCARHINDHKHR
jgi:Zn-dependent protease